MHTLLAMLMSSHVPFVHFDDQATPLTISPEARLLLGDEADARLEPLVTVARHISGAPVPLAEQREFSFRAGPRSIQVAALSVTAVSGRPHVLMVLSVGDSAPLHRDLDLWQLTVREREVAEQVAIGMPSPAIARLLNISVHTVRRHTERVFSKTGVRSRTELSRLMSGSVDASTKAVTGHIQASITKSA